MDLSTIISAVTANLHILIPALFLGWYLNTASFRGAVGEVKVRIGIRFFLGSEYTDLHDVTLHYKSSTTQIDHVVLSKYGVFVIETKNYNGWIYGDASSRRWTQTLGRKKFKFQNPLHQNQKHVSAVCENLKIDSDNVFSVIAFVGNSKLKTQVPTNVCEGLEFVRYIRTFKRIRFSVAEVAEFEKSLTERRLRPGFVTTNRHVKNIKRASMQPKCPCCGNQMIKRTATKGKKAGSDFWGCSNFPKCRGVVAIH